MTNIDRKRCKEVPLPLKRKHVTIFVDAETGENFTTKEQGTDGEESIVLAKLYLDRLSTTHQILHYFGKLQLDTVYVMNATPNSETSSMFDEKQHLIGAH